MSPVAAGFLPAHSVGTRCHGAGRKTCTYEGGRDAPVAAGFLPAAQVVRDAMMQVGKPAPTGGEQAECAGALDQR